MFLNQWDPAHGADKDYKFYQVDAEEIAQQIRQSSTLERVEKAVSKVVKFRMELEKVDEPFDEESCKRYSGWILSAIKKGDKKGACGILSQYADPGLREKEKGAWERAMVEKYGKKEMPVTENMTREEIIEQLTIARKHADEGMVIEGHQASANIREKYGL